MRKNEGIIVLLFQKYEGTIFYLTHLHRLQRIFMALRRDPGTAVCIDPHSHFRQKRLDHQRIGNDTDIGTKPNHRNALKIRHLFQVLRQLHGTEGRLIEYLCFSRAYLTHLLANLPPRCILDTVGYGKFLPLLRIKIIIVVGVPCTDYLAVKVPDTRRPFSNKIPFSCNRRLMLYVINKFTYFCTYPCAGIDSKNHKTNKYDNTYTNHETFRSFVHENLLTKIRYNFSIMKNREIFNVQQYKEKIVNVPHILRA